MNTNETLAQDDVRHQDGPAPETKGRRIASPAIVTRRANPLAALSRAVAAQTRQIKAISAADARRRLAEAKGRATHALRATVEQKHTLSRRGRADVLLDHKLDRITGHLDRLDRREREDTRRANAVLAAENRKLRRPPGTRAGMSPSQLGRGPGYSAKNQAFAYARKCTMQYLRTGQDSFNGQHLSAIQQKAGLHTGSNPDGGFLVHPEHDTGPLEQLLLDAVIMRQIANVRPISGPSLKKPVDLRGTDAEWVGERQARNDTETPDIAELDFPAFELHAKPKASMSMLEDGFFDIEAWLAQSVAEAFAQKEELAFISGDGVNKPKGLLAYDMVDNASWAWGKVGYLVTGQSGAFATAGSSVNQGDKLWDLIYALKAGYRTNAKFLMNSGTVGKCRQLKDGEGRWIWADARDSQPAMLCGFPVEVCEQMPNMASDSHSIAFGDFVKSYVIVDRVGMQVLRDNLTAYPWIKFPTRKRVGGGIQNFEAFKTLKFGSS